MESLVSLQYPHGRVHKASLTMPERLKPGDQFELHGRHWRAVGSKPTRSRNTVDLPRLLCVSAETHTSPQLLVPAFSSNATTP
jgi:hypothetical protein